MSPPDGYMVKGQLYPAMSHSCEKAMADYIEELEGLAVIADKALRDNDMFTRMPSKPTGFSSYGIDGKILWALKEKYEAIYGPSRNS